MARMFHVRVAEGADDAAVGALLRASYSTLMSASYPADVLAAALPLMTVARPELLMSGTFFVAVPDATGAAAPATLIGCGGWTPERPGAGTVVPGVGHVRHFATHPAWIRAGIGRAIMSVIVDQARSAGSATLEALSSLGAEPFYAALGFEPIRATTVVLAGTTPFPSVEMRRKT